MNRPGQIGIFTNTVQKPTEIKLTTNASNNVIKAEIIGDNNTNNFAQTPKPNLLIHGGNNDACVHDVNVSNDGKIIFPITPPSGLVGTGYSMNLVNITISPPPNWTLVPVDASSNTNDVFRLKFDSLDYEPREVVFETGDQVIVSDQGTNKWSVEVVGVNELKLERASSYLTSADISIGTTFIVGETAEIESVEYHESELWKHLKTDLGFATKAVKIGNGSWNLEKEDYSPVDGSNTQIIEMRDGTGQYKVSESIARALVNNYADGDIHFLSMLLAQYRKEMPRFSTPTEDTYHNVLSNTLRWSFEDRIKYLQIKRDDPRGEKFRKRLRILHECNIIANLDDQSLWPLPSKMHTERDFALIPDSCNVDFTEKWETNTNHSLWTNNVFSFDADRALGKLTTVHADIELHTISNVNYIKIGKGLDDNNNTINQPTGFKFTNSFLENIIVINQPSPLNVDLIFKYEEEEYNVVDFALDFPFDDNTTGWSKDSTKNGRKAIPELPRFKLKLYDAKSQNHALYELYVEVGAVSKKVEIQSLGADCKVSQFTYSKPKTSEKLFKDASAKDVFDHNMTWDNSNWVNKYPTKYRGRGAIQITQEDNYDDTDLGLDANHKIKDKPMLLAHYSILGCEFSHHFVEKRAHVWNNFWYCQTCNKLSRSNPNSCSSNGHLVIRDFHWKVAMKSPLHWSSNESHQREYPGVSLFSYRVNSKDWFERSRWYLKTLDSILHNLTSVRLLASTPEIKISSKSNNDKVSSIMNFFAENEPVLYKDDMDGIKLSKTRWVKFPETKSFEDEYIENRALCRGWCTNHLSFVLKNLGNLIVQHSLGKLVIHSLSREFGEWNGMTDEGYESGLDAMVEVDQDMIPINDRLNDSKLIDKLHSYLKIIIKQQNASNVKDAMIMEEKFSTLSSSTSKTVFRISVLPQSASKISQIVFDKYKKLKKE